MKFLLTKSETSVILPVFIQDSSSATGAGLGSLDQTSSITGGYVKRNGTGVALAVDENVTTEGTYEAPTTAGQVRIGTPANMITGVYELHFHNDVFTAADWVTVSLEGATNMAPLLIEVQLTNLNFNDGVRGGMTALPNAAADAAGGLPISDAGGLDMDDIPLNADTITLPGQTAPPLAPTATQAIGWLYKVLRNRTTQTATQWSLLADDESTVDAKATVSDDATTAIKQEIVSGP